MAISVAVSCSSRELLVVKSPIDTNEFTVTVADMGAHRDVGYLRTPFASCHVKNKTSRALRVLSFEICTEECDSHAQMKDVLLPNQAAFVEYCATIPYANDGEHGIRVRVLSEPIAGAITSGRGSGVSKRQKQQ